MMPAERTARRRQSWFAIGLLLLAAALRSPGLTRGLWLDEIANIGVLTRPAIRDLFDVAITTGRSPFLFGLYRPWLALAGDSALAARWPALLCGVAGVALIWRLGRRWGGAQVGLAAAILLACNPLHIWYSQEASFYTAVAALALLAVWQSVEATAHAAPVRQSAGRRAGQTLSMAALLASSPWTVFVLAALALWVWRWRRRHWSDWLRALALALLLSLPALLIYLHGAIGGWSTPGTRPPLPLAQMAYALLTLAWGFGAGPPPDALRQALATGAGAIELLRPHLGWLILSGGALALCAGLRLHQLYIGRRRLAAWEIAALLWLGGALVGANLLAWWAQTNFNVRYVLFALPALLLLLAGLDRRLAALATALAILFLLRSLGDPAFAPEDLQAPAQFLRSAVQPDDALILRAPEVYLLAPLVFYGAPDSALTWYNRETAYGKTADAFIAAATAGRCRIWLWSARAWLVDPADDVSAALRAAATPALTHRWPGSELTLYRRAACP